MKLVSALQSRNASSRTLTTDAICIVCLILAWIGITLRFYVRLTMTKLVQLDDWVLLAGCIAYSFTCGFYFVMVDNGSGKHNWELTTDQKVMVMKFWYHCEWGYVLNTTLIKAAFALFYLSFAIEPLHRTILKCLLVFVLVFDFAYEVVIIFQCWPVTYTWTRWAGEEGKCIPDLVILIGSYGHSVIMSTIDCTLAIFPIIMLRHSPMNFRDKISVILLLGLGGVASVSTLVRFKYIYSVVDWDDWFYTTSPLGRVSSIEPGVALLAAGLAVSRPLLIKISLPSQITRLGRSLTSRISSRSSRQHKGSSSGAASDGTGASGSNLSGSGAWRQLPGDSSKDLAHFQGSERKGSGFGERGKATSGFKVSKWGLGFERTGSIVVETQVEANDDDSNYLGTSHSTVADKSDGIKGSIMITRPGNKFSNEEIEMKLPANGIRMTTTVTVEAENRYENQYGRDSSNVTALPGQAPIGTRGRP